MLHFELKKRVKGKAFNRSRLALVALLFLLVLAMMSTAQANNLNTPKSNESNKPWTLWRESNSLSVHYRSLDNSKLIEIKAQAKLQSSLSGFLLFLQDYPLIPSWLENAKEAYLIKQISDTENLFLTSFNGIWPVSEREMVIRSRYWQNPDLSVELAVQDASDDVDNPSNTIRIQIIKAHWTLSPLPVGHIKIEHTIIADPGGSVPLWIANKVSLRSMWKTLIAIEKQLASSPWQQMPIPGVKEGKL